MIKKRFFLVLALFFTFPFVSHCHGASLINNEWETSLMGDMQKWQVPGLSIAIVENDELTYSKGFGVCERHSHHRVDADTVFAIGSLTKAFTSHAIGLLKEEKKLDWEDPVRKYLPTFSLKEEYPSCELNLSDLLCHRFGLGESHGNLLLVGDFKRSEVVNRLRHISPLYSFRKRFSYNNLGYVVLGQVIEAVTQSSWDDFIDGRIFTPLKMLNSATDFSYYEEEQKTAKGHVWTDKGAVGVSPVQTQTLGAAGSIFSTANDMAKWMRFQLSKGQVDGLQIVNPRIMEDIYSPHILIEKKQLPTPFFSTSHRQHSYGLGWFTFDYHGKNLLAHTGYLPGMSCILCLIPEEKLGIVILTNMDKSPYPSVLLASILDRALGLPETDWSSLLFAKFMQEKKNQEKEAKALQEKKPFPRKKRYQEYVGEYKDSLYGHLRILEKKGKLIFEYSPQMLAELVEVGKDTFQLQWYNPVHQQGIAHAYFKRSAKGKVFLLEIKAQNIQPSGHFQRV